MRTILRIWKIDKDGNYEIYQIIENTTETIRKIKLVFLDIDIEWTTISHQNRSSKISREKSQHQIALMKSKTISIK